MKLVTYKSPTSGTKIGALMDGGQSIVDLLHTANVSKSHHAAAFSDMITLMEAGAEALDEARRLIDWAVDRGVDLLVKGDKVRLM